MTESFSSKDAFTWSSRREKVEETWKTRNKQNFDGFEASGEISFALTLILINGILREVAADVTRADTEHALFSPRNDDVPFVPGFKGGENEVGGTFALTKKDLSTSAENTSTVYVEVAKDPLHTASFTATTGITIYAPDKMFYAQKTGTLHGNIIDLMTDPEREKEFKDKLETDFKNTCELTENAAILLDKVKNRKRNLLRNLDEFNQSRKN